MATSTEQAATTAPESPPDVRGPTARLPAAVFAAGIAALVLVLAGTATVQVRYAISGGPLTKACLAEGLKPFNPNSVSNPGTKGAEGVCHIVEGLRSGAETVVLFLGLALGLAAMVAGFAVFRRMDSKRKREHAISGAVLGVQAVILGAFLLGFRESQTLVTFTRNFLNFAVLRGSLRGFLTGAKYTLFLAFAGE